MALDTYALLSTSELQAELGGGTGQDTTQLEDAINSASADIEEWYGGHLVTRGARTTYYSPREQSAVLLLAQFPIITLTSVHECASSPRQYGADELLVSNTDYIAESPDGALARLTRLDASGLPTDWETGWRTVKVIYSAGYATAAAVPRKFKTWARQLAALRYRETIRGGQGAIQTQDGFGQITRLPRAQVEKTIRHELMRYSEQRRAAAFEES